MKQIASSHNNVWHAVADANKLWYRLAERNLSLLGISLSEFRVLSLLSEQGTCPMVKLAHDQSMTKSGMTGLIDHLEDQGFIKRIRSKNDRRIINIEITTEGRKLIKKCTILYQQFVEKSLEDLSEEEIETLLRIVKKMTLSVRKNEVKK